MLSVSQFGQDGDVDARRRVLKTSAHVHVREIEIHEEYHLLPAQSSTVAAFEDDSIDYVDGVVMTAVSTPMDT